MKKTFFIILTSASVIIFSNCHSSKKAMAEKPKISYNSNMQTIIMNNCSPCHIPSKGGNKKALDNFTAVRDNIDDIIHRIELHPGEKGFMPFKKARLSDSTIAVIRQWKADGMIE